jgi:hypothetical protein
VFDTNVHLAPNAPWLLLALLTLGFAILGAWAYRFAIPPLPALARRALPALRVVALTALLWLLAQPVIERASGGGARLLVLLDRSSSMGLPASSGGPSRARVAEDVVTELRRQWRGRASVEVFAFASRLAPDSGRVEGRSATALGDAIAALAVSPEGERASGVVVVSDGIVNAGEDPVNAARAVGLPIHAVVVGDARIQDRAVTDVESAARAEVGRVTPVRVRIATTEERGAPIGVRLLEDGRELGHATVIAPGGGAEVTAEFRVTPARPGLAVWTAGVDSLAGEISALNNRRQIAVEVAPGRLGVVILSAGLNWDLTFLRRSLAGDSSLSPATWVRERSGFRALERGRVAAPAPGDLRGRAVVVLDAIAPGDLPAGFDAALSDLLRGGGAILAFGGPAPGLSRYRAGRLGRDLAIALEREAAPAAPSPEPAPEARELLMWDDDPARGERAWRAAAPLSEVAPIAAGAGDRVLIGTRGGGPPLMLARRVGRGQALLVNGTGLWRWSLSGHDDLTAERGRQLWRNLVHWLAEPVQGEPLRLRPERWLVTGGEPARIFATLQDDRFRPIAGARVEGEVEEARGRTRRIEFAPGAAGSYVATLDDLEPGRYRVSARASRAGANLGRASTEFAVDRWSLEEARTLPDSTTLAGIAAASGGRVTGASQVSRWARELEPRALARGRTRSLRLWESPWLFGVIVGALGLEWAWRRRRGLP